MRMIGHLDTESGARTFSDFLYAKGIVNEVERERNGAWALWIHAEDQIEAAKALLYEYRADPNAPRYLQATEQARQKWQEEQRENETAQKRYFDRGRLFPLGRGGPGYLTVILIVCSVATTLVSSFGDNHGPILWLFIAESAPIGGPMERLTWLPEIRNGEIWRLFTPVFIHFGIPHLLFNMLWMFDLGSMVERRQGTWRLAILVLVIAALSNLGQYLAKGPLFGGMSGVVYGLIGYIWLRGKFDPASGLFLHPTTVTMAMIWFVMCFAGVIGHVANTAHSVGLVTGLGFGYFSALAAARGPGR